MPTFNNVYNSLTAHTNYNGLKAGFKDFLKRQKIYTIYTYFKTKNSLIYTTQISSLKYVYIVFFKKNQILEWKDCRNRKLEIK